MENLETYETYLRNCELSEGTCRLYLREAAKFLDYLDGREVSKDELLLYRKKMISRGLSPATINLYTIAVNKYLRYVGCQKVSVRTLRIQKKNSVENVINKSEYRELLAYAKKSGRNKYYYIMKTLALTGIRISELSFFTVDALKRGKIQVYNKGKIREIYLPDCLVHELKEYCKMEKRKEGIIFRGRNDAPIGRTAVYKMMMHLGDMVGIPREKVHPHSFRHFFAITYMEHYANLTELADLLGHASVETTRIYTTSTVEEKRRRLNNLGL